MTPLLVLLFVALIAGAGLLSWGVAGQQRGSADAAPRLWRGLLLIRARWETRLGAEEIRRDAAQLLRQLSALLQSGRGVGQAWGDLHDHWARRDPDHPIVRLCAHAAAGDRSGRGAEEGLHSFQRRHRDQPPRLIDMFAAPAASSEQRLMSAAAAEELGGTVHRLTGVAALSSQTGAPLSRLVEQIASAADDAAELHAQVRTAAAGPRVTQTILALLPLGGAAIGQLIGADAAGVLFGSVLGWGCLIVGGVLMTVGWWWSSRMIAQVVDHV